MENEFKIKTLEKEIQKIEKSWNNSDEQKKYKIIQLRSEISLLKITL